MKLNPALIDGQHPSEHPEVKAAAARADLRAQRLDEPHAVWIRPNSATCFIVPDDTQNRLAGCVMVYSTADGWLQLPPED